MSETVPDQIRVKGQIHIGRGLDLVQTVKHRPTSSSFFDVGRPQGMAQIDYTPHLARPGELAMEELEYSLLTTDGNIYIKDKGLCCSYGIFGAPGSGKTYLVKSLLRQILALHKDDPDMKYGGLILDPKPELIGAVKQIATEAGRLEDLVILNTDELIASGKTINVIHSSLNANELAKLLVLAAQSAGVVTSDPYWMLSWQNLFGAAFYLLDLGNDIVTLRDLMNAVLTEQQDSPLDSGPHEPEAPIQSKARQWRESLDALSPEKRQDAEQAINMIEKFFRQKGDSTATIHQVIYSAYSPFQLYRYNCYSPQGVSKEVALMQLNLYDQIIEDGKIVLVSLSSEEPGMAKTLCTLVKCLFQRSVLSRYERCRTGRLKNFTRPLILACDEYSKVASEIPGQPIGDADFFSTSRSMGCMGIIATQSVNMLQSSSLKDAWKAVFSTFGAKVFMRLVDNETAEEATKLAGECDWYVTSEGTSRSKDGLGSSTQKELRERKVLPSSVLTQLFVEGDAVILGSLDGSPEREKQFIRFVHVSSPLNAGRETTTASA